MSIEGIGLLAIALGIFGFFAGPNFAVYTFVLSTLLAAAAAITLPSLGAANIQPAHLLLGFLVIALFSRRGYLSRTLGSLVFPRPGFWLLLAVCYGVASAFLLPRLFVGLTYVYAIARTDLGPGIMLVPLVRYPATSLSPYTSPATFSAFWPFMASRARPAAAP